MHNGGAERENWRGRVTKVDPASDRPVVVRWLKRTRDGFFAFRGGSHAVEVETLVELGDGMFHGVKATRKGSSGGGAPHGTVGVMARDPGWGDRA